MNLDWFWDRLRHCAICSCRSQAGLLLCRPCEERLVSDLLAEYYSRSFQTGSEHRWLCRWAKDDKFYERLVYALKGGRHAPTFRFLADLFVAYRLCQRPRRATLVYPSKGHPDHASQWARALGQVLAFPTYPLWIESQGKQSNLNREQRRRRQIRPAAIAGDIIFVDDVLTSGGTAKAAFLALGRPKKFTIWTIFFRPFL